MLFKLARRNLWRNARRTILTMGAMAVATFLVIVVLGIYDGMLWDMIDGATEMHHGHAKITAPQYRDDPKLHFTLSNDGLDNTLLDMPDVTGVAGRLRGFALLSFGDAEDMSSQPAELLGIDPAAEAHVTVLHQHVRQGRFLHAGDTTAIVLGVGLARRLDAVVGGEVPAMGQAADGSIAQEMFQIVGIIDSGDPMRDAMLAIVARSTLADFLVLEGQVHEWAIKLQRPLEAELWANNMQARFTEVEIVAWQEIIPAIAQYLSIWDRMQIILALIFYFAVILVAVNTMTMSFFERLREFAVMGAIGLRPGRMSRLIVLEGAILSTGAALIGGGLGIAASFLLYRYHIDFSGAMDAVSFAGTVLQPRLRSYPTAVNLLMPIGLMVVLGVLVSLVPAFRLRRLKPVEALNEV